MKELCDKYSELKFDKTEEYCPTGFVFLTNVEYGEYKQYENRYTDETSSYQRFCERLRSYGYIIQVADAFDTLDNCMNIPEELCLAIYIKRSDGNKTDIEQVWNELHI